MPNAADDDDAPHLLDSTMFWNAPRGRVRSYLLAKRDWLARESGWRHTIVGPACGEPAEAADFVDCGGWPLLGGLRLPAGRRAAARLIEQQSPDVIEVGDPYRLAWAGLDAAQRLGVPSVAFCHGNAAALAARLAGATSRPRESWPWRMAGAYLRRLYNQFDLVLAPSDALARELRDLGVARVQRQSLGFDGTVFHPGRGDRSGVRALLGVPDDTRLLIYAGRFTPEQNLPLLADVVRRLGPRYLLLAVGDGPAPPTGRQVRLLAGPGDALRLARWLASADAFVHAGDQESFGLTALQAMACGTPAVVRSAGALPEIVDSGAGLTVRSDRIDDWAEAITALFAAGRDSWSATARARALDYDWDAVMPALLCRYQRLIDGSLASVGVSHTSTRWSFGEATQPAVLWHAPVGAPRKDVAA